MHGNVKVFTKKTTKTTTRKAVICIGNSMICSDICHKYH